MIRTFTAWMLASVFVVFAALQWNDPDALLWVAIYLLAAVLCLMAALGRLRRRIAVPAIAAYGLGAFLQWPDRYEGLGGTMEGHPAVELARESLGLLICGVALAVLVFWSPKSRTHG